MNVFLRSGLNYDVDQASLEAGCDTGRVSLAQQQFKEECDINTIVRRFGLTGELPTDLQMPVSGDFTDVVDFHTAMNVVASAQQEFMRLPGEVRARFAHDPGRLMAFLDDESNRPEAVKLGLVSAREPAPEPSRLPPQPAG